MLDQRSRPRRNRKHAAIRAWHQETWLGPEHFVYPVFIHDERASHPIASMPGQSRLGLDDLKKEVEGALSESTLR